MKIIDDKPWFAPMMFGVGAGFPIAWQGWVVLVAFVAGLAADACYLTGALRILGICLVLGAFITIAALKTEGGWRWRSGGR